MNDQDKKVLRVGVLSGVATLDPRQAADGTTSLVLRQAFEPPFVIESAFASPEPRLFVNLDHSADHRVFTGKLREGVKFSDGTELDADVAVRSLRKTKYVTDRGHVSAKDGNVVFELRESYPKFDVLLTMSHCAVVHDVGTKMYGTGAFVIEEGSTSRTLQTGGSLRLVRNPHYDGRVSLDEIVFTLYKPDADGKPTKLLEAMGRGEVDLTTNLSSAEAHRLDLSNFHPSIQAGNSTGFMFMNVERPAMKDVKVRRAIAVLLDRARIAEQSFDRNPLAYVARSVLPPVMSRDPELFTFNRREAETLFEEVEKPKKLTMMIPWAPRPYAPNPRPMANEISEQLKKFEIETEIVEAASGEDFFRRSSRGDFDLAMAGWIADSPDPSDFFEAIFHSSSVLRIGAVASNALNLSRWSDPAMDDAISAYRSDPTEARKSVILQLVKDNVVAVPLITSQNVVVHSRRIRNFRPSSAGAPILARIDID